jgi:hypothetical protein
MEPATAT